MVDDNTSHQEKNPDRLDTRQWNGGFAHTRRSHLKAIIGGSAVLSGLGSSGSVSAAKGGDDGEEIQVGVTEGTNIAVTASPDGESIIIDHQGILFRLPREGGHAEQLTDVELEPAYPDYAPDGNRIVFQAYATGNYDLWTMAPDGSDVRQLTEGFYDDREPEWSPDGGKIAFASDRGENYNIWTLDVATNDLQQWTENDASNYEPTWSADGAEIAYVTDNAIKAVSQDGDTRTVVSAEEGERFHAPSWGPENEDIAYVRVTGEEGAGQADLMIGEEQVTDGEDVFVLPPEWLSANELMYTADGCIRVLELESDESSNVPFNVTFNLPVLDYERKSHDFDSKDPREVQGIDTPTLSPDGEHIAFVALNDLWVMKIGSPPYRITDNEFLQADPAWSPDGRYLAYSSDKAGTTDLWVHDMLTEVDRQVTSLDNEAAVSAAWSPDGSTMAFQNQDGAVFTIEVNIGDVGEEVETGEVRQLSDPLTFPSLLTWGGEGNTLAMAALHPINDRFGNGLNQILTIDVETKEKNYYPPGGKFDSISTRRTEGPVWSPDGRWMAFVVKSTLRVMPVNEAGEPTGPAEQITSEATDAPTWSGDSEWLLYLNNGQLKKVKRDGSETQEVPFPLKYHVDHPAGRTLIHAGRLWDGTSPDVHEDVTIEVVNNRIRNIDLDGDPPDEPHVDASDLTVIPGLWDSHVHRTYDERFAGDRKGRVNLAYGVTSTGSTADQAYQAIENSEAIKSGERVGPRFFVCGELLDGSRVSWPLNRPTTSIEQIPLEMSRAIELDYDFAKAYIRTNARRMRKIAEIAHEEMGVPTGSHNLAPGAFVGEDGITHLDPGSRFGFSRTESVTSQAYDDVKKIHAEGDRWLMTTFFTSEFILADDIADDPRTQLFPPWTREELRNDVRDNTEVPSDPDCTTEVCRDVAQAKEVFDSGTLVLTGSDAPLDYTGLGVHSQLRPLAEYGFSPYEALLTATKSPAEYLGVEEDLGTLESGKLADMVFVEGNPLENIEDAIQVQMTMQGGELFTIEDLVEPFSSEDQ